MSHDVAQKKTLRDGAQAVTAGDMGLHWPAREPREWGSSPQPGPIGT